MNYCYFIISCRKNINLLNLFVDNLLKNTNDVNIYISFDDICNHSYLDERINVIDNYDELKNGFGNRVACALYDVKEKFVIAMCDDFIVEKCVNEDEINNLINIMIRNTLISSISLAKTSGKKDNEIIKEHYIRNNRYANFSATLQCAIWNKNALINLMRGVRSPWEFEIFSNFKIYSSKNLFYSLIDDKYQPIVYNRGSFIIRGKIVEPERLRLEKVLNQRIILDGFDKTNSYKQVNNISLYDKIKRRIKMIIYNIYYRIKSLNKFNLKDLNINTYTCVSHQEVQDENNN